MKKLTLVYQCCKRDCPGEIVVIFNFNKLMPSEVVVYCPECSTLQIARIAGLSYAKYLSGDCELEDEKEFIKPHRLIG